MTNPTWLKRIFHPTDFTRASQTAFFHALQLALHAESSLHILHVDSSSSERSWSQFPKVRATLARWGLLPENAEKADLAKLKLGIHKSIARDQDPRKAMLHYLEKHVPDLMVLSTRQREGLARLLKPSVAASLARDTGSLTLFIPEGAPGFVRKEDGAVTLRRILIPIDFDPPVLETFEIAQRFCDLLNCPEIEATLLHVVEQKGPIDFQYESRSDWKWDLIHGQGDPVTCIIEHAERKQIDLIVMGTMGRVGILDALRGSTTERVINTTHCPVLAVNRRTQ